MNEECEMDGITTSSVIEFDTSIFGKYRMWEGVVPAGYFSNCLGTLTRNHYWKFPDDWMALFASERYERPSIPADEGVIDLRCILEAVDQAKNNFVMIALGAGWGRWLVCGAAGARQRGMPFELIGVEAEPTHFQWMLEHFRDNGIEPSNHRLVEAAAAGKVGKAWFCHGEASGWYGQAIVGAETLTIGADGQRNHCGHFVKKIRTVDIEEVTKSTNRIDCMQMDIQGAELEFLSKRPKTLNRKVKRVIVGTHSEEIGAGIRELFCELRWQCCFDYPMNSHILAAGRDIILGDGAQYWINPNL